ncbi:unnamed protein product [Trichobilharzia regenti]|nr:unnamed protein product [Trichobilharzia regenti]
MNEKKTVTLFTENLMNKFVQGLRITRLLNRIKCRLLMGHGHLLRNIIQMITNLATINETIMEIPIERFIVEPLLNIEELCCRHFLRLSIESFILHYFKHLESIRPFNDNSDDDDVIHLN